MKRYWLQQEDGRLLATDGQWTTVDRWAQHFDDKYEAERIAGLWSDHPPCYKVTILEEQLPPSVWPDSELMLWAVAHGWLVEPSPMGWKWTFGEGLPAQKNYQVYTRPLSEISRERPYDVPVLNRTMKEAIIAHMFHLGLCDEDGGLTKAQEG